MVSIPPANNALSPLKWLADANACDSICFQNMGRKPAKALNDLFVLLDGNPFGLLGPLQGCDVRRGEGVTVVLGEMDVARVNPIPFWSGSTPSALSLVPIPPANDGHASPGGGEGDARSSIYPADDVHQDRITKGTGDGR